MIWSTVSASKANISWPNTLACPRTRTGWPPHASLRRALVRSPPERIRSRTLSGLTRPHAPAGQEALGVPPSAVAARFRQVFEHLLEASGSLLHLRALAGMTAPRSPSNVAAQRADWGASFTRVSENAREKVPLKSVPDIERKNRGPFPRHGVASPLRHTGEDRSRSRSELQKTP